LGPVLSPVKNWFNFLSGSELAVGGHGWQRW